MNRNSTAIVLLFLSACSLTGSAVLPPVENGPLIQAYFCPEDDCNSVLLSMFENASDIACALYSIDVPELKNMLKTKHARIVADNSNNDDFTGLDAVFDSRNALMHNKFCVLDKTTVITGSYNPTTRQKANNIIIIPSNYLALNYLAEFDEMRQGRFGAGKPVPHPVIIYNNATIQTAFCPEDNCQKKVLGALKDAKQTVRFMTYSFTDDIIGSWLAAAPFEVKGIFDSSQLGEYSEYQRLANKSIVRSGVHHKVFIIDDTTVITGSYNPTKNGDEKNDENLLIINDAFVAKKYIAQFDILYR